MKFKSVTVLSKTADIYALLVLRRLSIAFTATFNRYGATSQKRETSLVTLLHILLQKTKMPLNKLIITTSCDRKKTLNHSQNFNLSKRARNERL